MKNFRFALFLLLCISGSACASFRPPFYDPDNIAEYYGGCPKCHQWVKGYWGNWDYADETGKLIGGGTGVTGTCERCGADLIVDNPKILEHESRIVRWKLQR